MHAYAAANQHRQHEQDNYQPSTGAAPPVDPFSRVRLTLAAHALGRCVDARRLQRDSNDMTGVRCRTTYQESEDFKSVTFLLYYRFYGQGGSRLQADERAETGRS